MKTKIISAFPGVGKTYYHERNKEISIDSDSSHFSWVKDSEGNNTKERNPEFPFEQEGRMQDEQEAKLIDKQFKNLLEELKLPYKSFLSSRESIPKILDYILN